MSVENINAATYEDIPNPKPQKWAGARKSKSKAKRKSTRHKILNQPYSSKY